MVGKGYVGEAVAAITRFAFEKLSAARVEIRTDNQNTRSFRVAERLGFKLEGIMRRDARTPQGSLRDTRLYSMVDLIGPARALNVVSSNRAVATAPLYRGGHSC